MTALTQEKREELIAHGKEIIERISDYGDSTYPAKTIKIIEIALASLTADPSGYRWFHEGSSETRGWYVGCFPLDNNYLEKCLADKSIHSYEPLFTAPPVPEIKLPPEFNESHDSFSEFRRGWNGAISEVKRTNGLGE